MASGKQSFREHCATKILLEANPRNISASKISRYTVVKNCAIENLCFLCCVNSLDTHIHIQKLHTHCVLIYGTDSVCVLSKKPTTNSFFEYSFCFYLFLLVYFDFIFFPQVLLMVAFDCLVPMVLLLGSHPVSWRCSITTGGGWCVREACLLLARQELCVSRWAWMKMMHPLCLQSGQCSILLYMSV